MKSLKKGILYVLMANVVTLLLNLITNFILPKYLSVETYAGIKSFQLYISYIGVISLGYVDGMYLKYGGKSFEKIEKNKLSSSISTFRLFQGILEIAFAVYAICIDDMVLLSAALAIVPLNMASYLKQLWQAVGDFGEYSKLTNITAFATFLINLLIVFVLKKDNPIAFTLSYVFIDTLIWILVELHMNKVCGIKMFSFDFKEFTSNIKSGILLMFGNFSSIILTSMDRWFVKILLDVVCFAQYSFAVSMEGFLNAAITPVTITLYNYFCNNHDNKTVERTRKYVLIFASTIVMVFYPAKFFLDQFMPQYSPASNVMAFLFCSQMFYIIIKAIYVNLYKAFNRQKKYFNKLISIVVIAGLLNTIFFVFFRNMEAFALGTLISAVIWLLLCYIDFKEFKVGWKETVYLFIQAGVFLFTSIYLQSILGFIIYLVCTILSLVCLMNNELKNMGKWLKTKKLGKGRNIDEK